MPRYHCLYLPGTEIAPPLLNTVATNEKKNHPFMGGKISGAGRAGLCCFILILLTLYGPLTAPAQQPVLVSMKNKDVMTGNGNSDQPSFSANGRYVAFQSRASDLVAQKDDNSDSDVFVRDLQTGTNILVSVRHLGDATGNDGSYNPMLSADGRYVAFQSDAKDLVANDTNFVSDVFVRDLQTGTTIMVSTNFAGTGSGNGSSGGAVISANGRVVTYLSQATNLIPNYTSSYANPFDVYAKDLQTGTAYLVSVNSAGTGGGNSRSDFVSFGRIHQYYRSVISADGRFVVFQSGATNMVSIPHNIGQQNIFMRDLQTGTTTLISVNAAGTEGASGYSSEPIISADGRYVVFQSLAANIVSINDTNNAYDLFIRDTQTNTTKLVTYNSAGNATANAGISAEHVISADGRFIAFTGFASDHVANDNNNKLDVFVRDMVAGVTKLVSIDRTNSTSGNGISSGPVISGDGRFVAFQTDATDVVSTNENNVATDVYLRDLSTNTTTLLSANKDGTGAGNRGGLTPTISPNGKIVAFVSSSSNLTDYYTPNFSNVFAIAVSGSARFDPNQYSISEQNGEITITVKRNAPNNGPATINIVAGNGTATAGPDFTPLMETLSFNTGEDSKTVILHIKDDTTDEWDETVNLIISDFADDGPGALGTATLTITDNDSPPSLSINDVTVTEGTGPGGIAVFNVSLSQISGKEISVALTPGTITAQSGVDFVLDFNKLTIAPGQLSADISIPVTGDTLDEFDETFTLTISNPANATILRGQATGTILDNDPPPSITITNIGVAEGNSGTSNLNFTVRLSTISGKTVAVDYATEDVTATAVTDYVAKSGTLTFISGERNKTLTVLVNGDTMSENNETFNVNLTNSQNATIADGQGTGNIINDDGAGVQFSSDSFSFSEDAWQGEIVVIRTGDITQPLTVDYITTDQSALTPCQINNTGFAAERCDYATAAGTLRFASGELSKIILIPPINDSYIEGPETFTISLRNAQGASLVTSTATVTIVDNDPYEATRNPINDQEFFVKAQYIDFLGRAPEPAGLIFWMNRMNNCPAGQICDRTDTAKRFFESDEFKERGYYVYKLYDVVLGRQPTYVEFVPDVARLNGPQTPAEQRLGKDAYLQDLINKQDFRNLYGQFLNQTGTQVLNAAAAAGFVDALIARAGITPASRQTLVDNLASGARTPAQTLEDFILTPEISEVGTKFYDRAIITMQYFGFLRRSPDAGGFNFWWNRVATQGSPQYHDYRELINNFLRSDEYNFRFAFIPAP
jgi:hypothetical protein